MKNLNILLLSLIFSAKLFAETPSASSKTNKVDEMNGIRFSDYTDFEKKWKLVTTRYRKDTGELRFTYANDVAYQYLLSGGKDYPAGSVFAKIGVKTVEDTSFPSSAIPGGSRRYQYMVRDKKKFESTDGWGYALFDKTGEVFPEDQSVQSAACAACHRIVPDKGFVFSEVMDISPFRGDKPVVKKSNHYSQQMKFIDIEIDKVPEIFRKEIPSGYKSAKQIDHEISKFLFSGTLDEIKPLLAREAGKYKVPVFIIAPDNKRFAIVYIENLEVMCESEGQKGYFMKAISTSYGNEKINNEHRFCWVP